MILSSLFHANANLQHLSIFNFLFYLHLMVVITPTEMEEIAVMTMLSKEINTLCAPTTTNYSLMIT